MSALAPIHVHLRAHADAGLARIQDFVRIPSISPERRAIAEGAAFMAESLRRCGCADVAVVDVGDGFPGVFGQISEGAAETLLIYSHYDVRPIAELGA